MIIDPSIDEGVELSLYQTGTYEKGILSFLEESFDDTGLFVDVGANIGLMSVFVANKFKNSEVVAFEAHPKTAEILRGNIELNDLSNIQIVQKALGAKAGKVVIYDNWQMNRGAASIMYGDEGNEGYEVEMTTLDSVMNRKVSLVKIDVEGAELDVLKGMQDVIVRDKPTLIVEISKGRTNDENEIFSLISNSGIYDIFKLKGSKERKSGLIEVTGIENLPDHDNIICIPKK
jgi:FkbM family methyltransferase